MADPSGIWCQRLAGRFIVFDGPDGSGKSTQFRRFCAFAQRHGLGICEVREPGGTQVGEAIRQVLLDPSHQEMNLKCEMLLYMASRAQLVEQSVRPALQRGQLVLADRFISSTLAYQGTAGGIPVADILRVGQIALGTCWPDLVVVFDVDEQTAASRLSPLLDRIEMRGSVFHRMVRQGYLEQAQQDPNRYIVIDARVSEDQVFDQLTQELGNRLDG